MLVETKITLSPGLPAPAQGCPRASEGPGPRGPLTGARQSVAELDRHLKEGPVSRASQHSLYLLLVVAPWAMAKGTAAANSAEALAAGAAAGAVLATQNAAASEAAGEAATEPVTTTAGTGAAAGTADAESGSGGSRQRERGDRSRERRDPLRSSSQIVRSRPIGSWWTDPLSIQPARR
jgi:hypothetical protein